LNGWFNRATAPPNTRLPSHQIHHSKRTVKCNDSEGSGFDHVNSNHKWNHSVKIDCRRKKRAGSIRNRFNNSSDCSLNHCLWAEVVQRLQALAVNVEIEVQQLPFCSAVSSSDSYRSSYAWFRLALEWAAGNLVSGAYSSSQKSSSSSSNFRLCFWP